MKITLIKASIGIITKKNQVFLTKRMTLNQNANELWEFPGGKIKKHETPYKALKRELKEELDIEVNRAKLLMTTSDKHDQDFIKLSCFIIEDYKNYPVPQENQEGNWISIDKLNMIRMPQPNCKIINTFTKLFSYID